MKSYIFILFLTFTCEICGDRYNDTTHDRNGNSENRRVNKSLYYGSKYKKYRNCQEIQYDGYRRSGTYVIYPYDFAREKAVKVYCDQKTDGGGWTVIQRRKNITPHEDFYRTWMEYGLGFGDLEKEFWLGLDHIHALTDQQVNQVRFDITNDHDDTRFAQYKFFYVHSRAMDYIMEVNGHSGTLDDSFSYHNGERFSTYDKDMDMVAKNCAEWNSGGWWYKGCYFSNLNGVYRNGYYPSESKADGIVWFSWNGNFYSHKETEIKIRPLYPFNEDL